MKRRNFISIILASSAIIGFGCTEKALDCTVRNKEELFKRFFRTATGFELNETQRHNFTSYIRNEKTSFANPRQTGTSTLMRVLALYESKVNHKDILLIEQNATMSRKTRSEIHTMAIRLGKSIHDGNITIKTCRVDNLDMLKDRHDDLIFQNCDALKYNLSALYLNPRVPFYHFGTYEERPSHPTRTYKHI